jgi:serine protease Do
MQRVRCSSSPRCLWPLLLSFVLLAPACDKSNGSATGSGGSATGSGGKGKAAGSGSAVGTGKASAKPKKKRSTFSIFAKPAFAYAASKGGPKQVSISDIAERAVRGVVNVRSTKNVDASRHPLRRFPFFRDGRGVPRSPRRRRARSLGSGVIVSKDGIVLTNHHVVRHADEIRVTLSDDQEYVAKLVGSDPKSDIAVLRIEAPPKNLQPLPVGESTKLRLGEVVLAIGNPFGVGQTVTMGIVSAVGRANVGIVDYEDFIQTDAAINPGNSGGALVNMRGELVGINTAILSRSGGYQGIGFAVPTQMAKPIMESLVKHGRVIRGWLGVMIQNLDKRLAKALGLGVKRGVLVTQVQPGSPAQKAGLRRGDVVVRVDGKPMRDVARLRNAIAVAGAKRMVKLSVVRGDKTLEMQVTLGELPSAKVATFTKKQGGLGGLTLETIGDEHRRRLGMPRGLRGVIVTEVKASSAAARAGLRKGDVVLEINRHRVANTAQFTQVYRAAGGQIALLVFRGGTSMYVLLEK